MLDLSFLVFPSLLLPLSYAILLRVKRPNVPYPPGPAPKPIIGNLLEIPFSQRPWMKYLEWSSQLNSEIIHVSALHIHVVVLHTLEDATELLEKRSAIYSDRPTMPIIPLIGVDFSTPLLPYGERWRKHRRVFQETLRKDHVPSYHTTMSEKIHILLGKFLHEPEEFAEHCKWLAASFALSSTFAYNVTPENKTDGIVEAADNAARLTTEMVMPGRTMINILPILGRVPPWIPGASTQKLAASAREAMVRYKTVPFDGVKRNMAANDPKDCILTNILQYREEQNSVTHDDDTLQDVMATMYLAGVETVQSVETTMVFSIAFHPEQQRKAQEEIDRVVGTDRLPTFDDRASLPYVEALHREIQRWRPIIPLGVPHSTVKDDIYKGFYIPKGTIVMPNVWAFTRDPTRYNDPERFMPERFFDADGVLNDDSLSYVFGFGRRICPGRHVADSMLWLELACILSTFNISKAKDDNGNEIDISPDAFIDSVVTHPIPFKCSIVPRSAQAEALVNNAASNARKAQ